MSTPVRAQDREHFSIVQESLARDGLHVAMTAHDHRRLQDYAGMLARSMATQAGLRVEAYHPDRLESVVVDLMLHRFDAALSEISARAAYDSRGTSRHAIDRPGCILFVPDAHALSGAQFRQLLRIAAGSHRNGLRLVALFDAGSPHSEERIADLGTHVARWDLDDDDDAARAPSAPRWQRRHSDDDLAHAPLRTRRTAANRHHLGLKAAGIAALLVALPMALPTILPMRLTGNAESDLRAPQEDRTVTRSGIVELAGEPRQDFVRARTADIGDDKPGADLFQSQLGTSVDGPGGAGGDARVGDSVRNSDGARIGASVDTRAEAAARSAEARLP